MNEALHLPFLRLAGKGGTQARPGLLKIKRPFSRSFSPDAFQGPAAYGRRTGVRRSSYPSCSLEDMAMRTFDFSPLWRSTKPDFDGGNGVFDGEKDDTFDLRR
jgi:hypothetical protein